MQSGTLSFLTTELEELGVFYLIYDLCETETNSRGLNSLFKYVVLIISPVFSSNLKVGSHTFSPGLSHWMTKEVPSLLF